MAYKSGYEEDSFLQSLAPFEPREIELKAENCTKVGIIERKPDIVILVSNEKLFSDLGVAYADEKESTFAAIRQEEIS